MKTRGIFLILVFIGCLFSSMATHAQTSTDEYQQMFVEGVKTGRLLILVALVGKLGETVVNKKIESPIFEKYFDSTTPLHWAVAAYHINTTKLLLEFGADVNAIDSGGATPLHYAVSHRDMDTQILKEFEVVGLFEFWEWLVDEEGNQEMEAILEEFLIEKRTIDLLNSELGFDYEYHPNLVGALLVAGADVNAVDHIGSTPLHNAVSYPGEINHDVVKMLLDAGANVHTQDNFGRTPLHNSVILNSEEIVIDLLEAGADVNAKDYSGNTPLHWAINLRNLIGKLLEQKRVEFEVLEFILEEPSVSTLLEFGADVNVQDDDGVTPLHSAVSWQNDELVIDLLNAGAEVNVRDNEGNTPLFYAALNNDESITGILRKAGASKF